MANIKSMDRVQKNWVDKSAVSGALYEDGVRNPRASWAVNTAKAEGNYKAGVTAAANRGAFGKGVRKAGDTKWQEGSITKGVPRWSQGIALSKDAYAQGFKPYHDVIAGLVLPARGPKGDPANINRVAVISAALHKKKLDLQGS